MEKVYYEHRIHQSILALYRTYNEVNNTHHIVIAGKRNNDLYVSWADGQTLEIGYSYLYGYPDEETRDEVYNTLKKNQF